jgi:hypothetical protein
MPKTTCPVCNGTGIDPKYGYDPLIMEVCPTCYGRGVIKLTPAQSRVFAEAKKINGWFISSDIDSQERTIHALVAFGLLETHWPSGGPMEYRAACQVEEYS